MPGIEIVVAQDEPRARELANQAMERYADGDDAAFSELYDAIAPRLRRFAAGLAGSEAGADDVVQQTLLQIHLSRARFVRGAPVLPWAYAIARNLVRDEARKRTTAQAGAQAAAHALEQTAPRSPDAALDDKRREEALNQALLAVPEKLRVAFLLVEMEGLSLAEAAQALAITEGNVRVRVHRARQLLLAADSRRSGL